MAAITAFNMSDTNEVVLKARGRAISAAVDVAEITRNRFFKDAKVRSVVIGTEEVTPREGGNFRNVSTMEITIKKRKPFEKTDPPIYSFFARGNGLCARACFESH